VTGLHRGLKRIFWAGYRASSLQRTYDAQVLFFIVGCGRVVSCTLSAHVRTMHIFDIQASYSPPRLPLCQISFRWQPPLLS